MMSNSVGCCIAGSIILLLLVATHGGNAATATIKEQTATAAAVVLRRDGRQLQEKENDAASCEHDGFGTPLIFTVIEGDATGMAVEDDIRQNLEEVGIAVTAKLLSKDDWNAAQTAGDFHLSFTETWGAPYDPHSYAAGWINGSGGEGHHQAFTTFSGSKSREELYGMIQDVLQEEDRKLRSSTWLDVHKYYHEEALMLPLWGKRIPTVMNTRLSGYQSGHQQFDYPVHKLVVVSGSSNITIAPSGQTGLFQTVGPMNPHTYRPNEFFSNNWVYEGLVSYAQGGQVLPALAKSWTISSDDGGDGEVYLFQLRENVTFHDGTPWNCMAAKMNFDHALAGKLSSDYHNWYGVPLHIDEWSCNGDLEFVVKTKIKYAPFLQELTYTRPLRFLSPVAFAQGNTTSANTANSCDAAWGTIGSTENPDDVVCAGISAISGTGPFKFASRKTIVVQDADDEDQEVDSEVIFEANENYWDGPPTIEAIKIVRYKTSDDVKTALLDGSLDVLWGSGVLPGRDIADIQESDEYQEFLRVFHSLDVQNVILLLNSGKPPLDNILIRKTILHAINKASIVEKELSGLQNVVDNVFPLDAPDCDVDLTPRWDYDIEKANLLICESSAASSSVPEDDDSSNQKALALGLGLGIPCALAVIIAVYMYIKRTEAEAELDLFRKQDGIVQA